MPVQPNPPARHRKFAPAGRPPRPDHELRIELAIGPVVEPGTFRPFACRKTTPSRRSQTLRDLRSRAGDWRLAAPGSKMMVGADAGVEFTAHSPEGL